MKRTKNGEFPDPSSYPRGFMLPEFRFATLYDDNALDIAFVPEYARALDSALVPRFKALKAYGTRKNSIFFPEKSIVRVKFISTNKYLSKFKNFIFLSR